ncbi:MAG: hypothetical protein JRH10_10825 [Deltaproteobacteria bacterium]|nr:hypothetical protein [Deltaproteobacteria bacterium]MBW2445495.1 hypothetical protein [Deltaproteobacteria bacterium]
MKHERHPTQAELLEGAVRTLEDVLVPELQTPWARTTAMGLVGQLRYAAARAAADSLEAQDIELASCIDGLLAEFPALREVVSTAELRGDRSWDLRARAGRLLIHALDGDDLACAAIRSRLRPVLTAHVQQDLGETGPMLQAFLASGSLGSTG